MKNSRRRYEPTDPHFLPKKRPKMPIFGGFSGYISKTKQNWTSIFCSNLVHWTGFRKTPQAYRNSTCEKKNSGSNFFRKCLQNLGKKCDFLMLNFNHQIRSPEASERTQKSRLGSLDSQINFTQLVRLG